jgi:4-diphosphocytidyl-2-C-methyl-D-erythritol kinase
MPSLRLPAFAKINFCLHLVGRRADGYTELRTIYQAISLHDELRLSTLRGRGIELEVESSVELSRADRAALAGRQNLVARALELLRRELGIRAGLHVRLTKHIPVGRGLGGGSSDAAAAMVALLRLARKRLPLEKLLALASRLGADVPFFLLGGRALGVGRGDEVFPLPDGPRRTVVVVSPDAIAVPTRDAYRWAAARLTKPAGARKLWRFCALCWSAQGAGFSNDFEAPVFRRHPRLGRLKRELLRRGAADAALAGSGSAVFGVFPNPAQARRAACGFLNDQVFIVETLSREEYVRALGGRRGGLP